MDSKAEAGIIVLLSIIALLIGFVGIAILIGVGEGTNNAIAAFAAVSFPFALLAGFLSWIRPRGKWVIAIAMSAPVAIICLMSASMGAIYIPGAIWTVLISIVGAHVGGRLRRPSPGVST
jgi:hypothetical protein